ncbi:MAG: hypothetical protein LBH50_01860 [Spirochaetaceae bacterium]|jgi:hypothetical protein|nr:hypothetical protein [Spirochaetaceae bacterium]
MTNENWSGDKRRKPSRRGSRQQRGQPEKPERGQSFRYGDATRDDSRNTGRSFPGNGGNNRKTGKEQEKNNKNFGRRPKWTAAKLRTDPIPTPLCPCCKEPIKDLACAIMDKNGEAVHFECVQKRISAEETLEKGDTVTYIGGGRFGIMTFENPRVLKSFKIKKIIEWEKKDERAEWRGNIADHFSLT